MLLNLSRARRGALALALLLGAAFSSPGIAHARPAKSSPALIRRLPVVCLRCGTVFTVVVLSKPERGRSQSVRVT